METSIGQPLVKEIVKTVTTSQGKAPEPITEKVIGQDETKVATAVSEPEKIETKPTEAKEEPKVTLEDYAAKLAAISKKEAYLTKREKELKEKETKLSPLEKTIQEKSILKTFENMGLTFEQGMELAIKELEGKKEPDVKDQIKALEQRLIAKEKAEEEQRTKATEDQKQAAFKAFVEKTTAEVKAKEEFELVNKYESYNLVIDVINEYFNKTGEILASDKAALEVEKFLESQAEIYLSTNKYKTKYPVAQPVKKDSPTLSNSMTPSTSVPPARETKEQRLARAASMLKYT